MDGRGFGKKQWDFLISVVDMLNHAPWLRIRILFLFLVVTITCNTQFEMVHTKCTPAHAHTHKRRVFACLQAAPTCLCHCQEMVRHRIANRAHILTGFLFQDLGWVFPWLFSCLQMPWFSEALCRFSVLWSCNVGKAIFLNPIKRRIQSRIIFVNLDRNTHNFVMDTKIV